MSESERSAEPVTASSSSRCTHLTEVLDLHVDGVRHYLHLQIGKPLSKDLISAPEIALDNLHREVKSAIQSSDVARQVGSNGVLKFGDPVENMAASDRNPIKRGIFIRKASAKMAEYATKEGCHSTPLDNLCALAAQPPAAPVIPPEVLERRNRGLTDYERPPLGQPPSWLQEQEKIVAPDNGSSAPSKGGMKLYISEPEPRESGAILISDDDRNDVAEFFHNEHATVGQSYETALALAQKLVTGDDAQSAKVTPAARWRANGEADPHGNQYDCERAGLAHGDMTDDEIANALFLKNYDIGIITAAKERIRWLSRALTASLTHPAPQPAPVQQAASKPAIGWAMMHPEHGIAVTTVRASFVQAQDLMDRHPKDGWKPVPVAVEYLPDHCSSDQGKCGKLSWPWCSTCPHAGFLPGAIPPSSLTRPNRAPETSR
ncbi:hypothetical protein ACIPUD_10480 [Bradyrhizobium sp. CAR08]